LRWDQLEEARWQRLGDARLGGELLAIFERTGYRGEHLVVLSADLDRLQLSREVEPRMVHPIYRVISVDHLGSYRLRVSFDDGVTRELDLGPLLEGELFTPLRDPAVFAKVTVDPEVHTLVWPNGADFDPATLHDWPQHEAAMLDLAKSWAVKEPAGALEPQSPLTAVFGSSPAQAGQGQTSRRNSKR
jgi:hypothetical protein